MALKSAAKTGPGERSGRRPARARRRLHDENAAARVLSPPVGQSADGPRRSPADMLAMQRLFGNRAVQRYIDGSRTNVIHRCGPTPCDCAPERKKQLEPANVAMARLLQRELPGLGDLIPGLDDLSLSDIVDQFAPDTGSIAPTAGCPPDFCAPMSSTAAALALRGAAAAPILAGIAIKVNPRVVNLWRQHIFGGSAPQDLSSDFGPDFASSATTAHVHDNLMNALKADIEANPPTFPPGVDEVTVDIPTRIPAAVAALDDPANTSERMDFNVISEIPGNIAGGIGKNQASTPVGAQPAPFDDSRTAAGTATVKKNVDGTLTITPHLTFTVRDTIDLCPGNCGADVEQTATRPLSWLEASGVSGDVPFTVEFSGPATTLTVTPSGPPPPGPGPVDGEVRASPHLRIREAPTTASAILGKYPDGTKITVECQVTGEDVLGNDKWDKTDKGFVSDKYVKRTDTPQAC